MNFCPFLEPYKKIKRYDLETVKELNYLASSFPPFLLGQIQNSFERLYFFGTFSK